MTTSQQECQRFSGVLPAEDTGLPAQDPHRVMLHEGPVAGFRYHEGPDILAYLQPGDPIDLIAEPGNPYDEWAVRVEHRKSRIGYLPRSCNRVVSRLLQQEVSVHGRITVVDPTAVPWEAVRVQVTVEATPEPRPTDPGRRRFL